MRHPVFAEYMERNERSEAGRQYCKHDMDHAVDAARVAYILNLEEGLGFSKEMVYAAALLHDITKWWQHSEGVPHHESAVEPATGILRDCGFEAGEIEVICQAIYHHRDGPPKGEAFSDLLFRADKLSRACYACGSAADCRWDAGKKNQTLSY